MLPVIVVHVYPVIGALSDHLSKMATLPNSTNADLSNHLLKIPELVKLINTDLSKGFTLPYVAEKYACPPFFWRGRGASLNRKISWHRVFLVA